MIATSITPIAQRHRLVHQRSTPASLGSKAVAKFQQPRFSQEEFARQNKPQLTRGVGIGTYVDHLTGDRRLETGTRESSTESETAFSTYLAASNSNNKDKTSFAGSSLTSSDESKTTTSRGNSVENHGGSSGYGASSS